MKEKVLKSIKKISDKEINNTVKGRCLFLCYFKQQIFYIKQLKLIEMLFFLIIILGGLFMQRYFFDFMTMYDTFNTYLIVNFDCFISKNQSTININKDYFCKYIINKSVKTSEIDVSYIIGFNKYISIFIDTYKFTNVTKKSIFKTLNFYIVSMIGKQNLCELIYARSSYDDYYAVTNFSKILRI